MGYVTDAAGLLFDGAMTQAVYIIVAVLGLLVCVLGLKLVRVWNVLTGLAVGLAQEWQQAGCWDWRQM